MSYARPRALAASMTIALLAGAAVASPAPARARASVPGGATAPSAPLSGGTEFGVSTRAVAKRPVVSELAVPSTATAGRPPRVSLRIDEKGVATVRVRVTVTDLATHKPLIEADMGWVHTGRRLTVTWPHGARLKAGSYHVSLAAHDHHSGNLLRRAHSSGVASLTVTAPKLPALPSPSPQAGVPTPAQSAAAGTVFPVAGAHNFGGPENRFGAPRGNHVHEGQDVLSTEGTPVVAPLAGTILAASYQAGGAGYYAVEHTAVGFDFLFAHCKAGSLAVADAQAVSAGQALCQAGQTGSATTPHLHFEMWVGGWQEATGHPIDPLAYLQVWDHIGATG